MFRSTLTSITRLMILLAVVVAGAVSLMPDIYETVVAQVRGIDARNVPQPEKTTGSPGMVALTADRSGHFDVSALINGRHVQLMADTGASLVALSYEEAKRLGLKPETLAFDGRSMTANGEARIAFAELETVKVGPIEVRDVRVAIAEPGALSVNLLGMSFIGRLSKFELKGSQLVLYR